MKAASKLYQDYLSQGKTVSTASDRLLGFLRKKLSFEDYMDAEEIVSEAILQTEEEAFCLGCTYLPNLIRDLMKD